MKWKRRKSSDFWKKVDKLFKGRQKALNGFESKIFSTKDPTHDKCEILAPKQRLQRLPIAHLPIKARNTSENLPNKIYQIIYSLCSKRKYYNSIWQYNEVNTDKIQIFIQMKLF